MRGHEKFDVRIPEAGLLAYPSTLNCIVRSVFWICSSSPRLPGTTWRTSVEGHGERYVGALLLPHTAGAFAKPSRPSARRVTRSARFTGRKRCPFDRPAAEVHRSRRVFIDVGEFDNARIYDRRGVRCVPVQLSEHQCRKALVHRIRGSLKLRGQRLPRDTLKPKGLAAVFSKCPKLVRAHEILQILLAAIEIIGIEQSGPDLRAVCILPKRPDIPI